MTMRNRFLVGIILSAGLAVASAQAPAPAPAPVQLQLDHGGLQVVQSGDQILRHLRVTVHLADGDVSGALVAAGSSPGEDSAGTYQVENYRLQPAPAMPGMAPPADAASARVTLEVRHYQHPQVVVALLDYAGPAPRAHNGIEVSMELPDFGRGLAVHRLKLWWTAPVFASDYRLLPSNNELLLWRQMRHGGYHLLVPLAGDGMMGELGEENYQFRVALSSEDAGYVPHHIPLFAFASSSNPYQLPRDTYTAAFAAAHYYGRLRWQKSYPAIYRWLGWCSWNTYYQQVTAQKVLNSVRSLHEAGVPIGFVLIDDGWLSVKNARLTAYGADRSKFPDGLAGLVKTLHQTWHIRNVGVWHAFQGYWAGVDPQSEIGRSHTLFAGNHGLYLPDPRDGAGEKFYDDWDRQLKADGIDFLKVDNQASVPTFTNGRLPVFASGEGQERNLQEAALKYFSDPRQGDKPAGVNLLNCMAQSIETAYNWHVTNLARNSDDYFPGDPVDSREHVFYNAYNDYWTSNFAYPDWDMFETGPSDGAYQAIARAISGGPVYTTDAPGKERADLLIPFALASGRLLQLDRPGQVTPDLLLQDPSLQPVALKVFGTITRPGLDAGMVAGMNVNKTAGRVEGEVSAADVPGLHASGSVAVYQRSTGRATLLDPGASLPFHLKALDADLFTLAPEHSGVAVFGLLDKYLGPAAVSRIQQGSHEMTVELEQGGQFGAWMLHRPLRVEVNGKQLPPNGWTFVHHLLTIPVSEFGPVGDPATVLVRW